MQKVKTKQIFKNAWIMFSIGIVLGLFICFLLLDDTDEASKVPKISEVFETTNAYKYVLENNLTVSPITFVDSIGRNTFLLKNEYSAACPDLTFNKFAFIYGKRFIVAINVDTFEVECDWVRRENE